MLPMASRAVIDWRSVVVKVFPFFALFGFHDKYCDLADGRCVGPTVHASLSRMPKLYGIVNLLDRAVHIHASAHIWKW
jgi:hypothetical protein